MTTYDPPASRSIESGPPPRRSRAALLAVLVLGLAGCSGNGPSWFNFSNDDKAGAGPVRESGKQTWLKNDVGQKERDADVRQCRDVAAAQVARDRTIDDDRAIGRATVGGNNETLALTRSMDQYSREQRQARLFASCMRSKGYRAR